MLLAACCLLLAASRFPVPGSRFPVPDRVNLEIADSQQLAAPKAACKTWISETGAPGALFSTYGGAMLPGGDSWSSVYCPVALVTDGELKSGLAANCAVAAGKVYLFSSGAARDMFIGPYTKNHCFSTDNHDFSIENYHSSSLNLGIPLTRLRVVSLANPRPYVNPAPKAPKGSQRFAIVRPPHITPCFPSSHLA